MTEKNISLIVVSDTICPWCYIGKVRLQQAIAMLPTDIKVSLRYEPYLLNLEMPAEGLSRKEYRTAKFGSWEKSQELDAQVEAAAAQSGITINHHMMQRTPNSILSHALIAVSYKLGVQSQLVDALFDAYFVKGLDIGHTEVLRPIAIQAGVEEAVVDAIFTEERLHLAVKEQAKGYGEAGISGVPTVLYDTEDGQIFGLFSGAQEARNVRDILLSLAKELQLSPQTDV